MTIIRTRGNSFVRAIRSITCFGLLLGSIPAFATVKSLLPDFYAEPGLNPFRDQVSANVAENIDPFSGTLTLTYTDLVVPGNGGLDIRIRRTYNSNNVYLSRKTATNTAPSLTQLLPRTPWGMGWTIHMGRVLKTGTSTTPSICDTNSTNPNDDTLNNPILELADGRQQILFVNSVAAFGASFITKDQWVASCIGTTNALLVISPEGTKYTMDFIRSGGFTYDASPAVDFAWYPSRIEDRNGNFLTISYNTSVNAGKNALIGSISANDGRTVSFAYTGTTATTVRLASISANGQTWQYQYTAVSGVSGGYFQLTRVTRPDNLFWNYSYWTKSPASAAGNRILQTATYPYGATITYDYGYVCFMATTCSSTTDTFNSLVVASKTNGGRDVAAGTWTYSYTPSSTEDVTTVSFPGGSHVYRHFGSKLLFGGPTICGTSVWKIGLLKQKQVFNSGTLIHQENYTWQPLFKISNEEYVRPPYDGSDANHSRYSDCDVFAPVLTQKDVIRDGTTYTTVYSNFDASFNPQTVAETGQATRTTNLSYFPRSAGQNIVRLVKDEILSGFGAEKSVLRTFDSKGNPTQIIRHGVTDNYTYLASGDLASHTNPRGKLWNYSNYVRGIPTSEAHPEAVTLSRTINNTGTIASETNGRGKTTSYLYDGMNRVTSITRPLGTVVSVVWNTTGRTVTRGTFSQATTFDGFGRTSLVNTNGITQDINYNVLGYKSFESYFSTTAGDSFTTDVLGRVATVTHPDTSSRAFTYSANNVVSIRDERNNTTTYTYRSFSDPDDTQDKVLMNVAAPESVSTVFTRDILGLATNVVQGGVTRSYSYSPTNNFLISETNPETGATAYGRDAVGNMTSRQVGTSSTALFTYDGLNRLTLVDYPGTTPDVTNTYDSNNNLTIVDNGLSRKTFTYDDNDNLTAETLTVNGKMFNVAYSYTALDYLDSMIYPSGKVIPYAPDTLGRATQVGAFASGATYHPSSLQANHFVFGNSMATDISFNNRNWTQRILAPNGEDLTYGYDPVGNVTGIADAINGTFNRILGYDGLDRLISATGPGGGSIAYDTADNITSKFGLSYAYSGNRLSTVSGATPYSFNYDTYGNVINNGRSAFVYDDAGNMRSASGGTPATSGAYDYDGKNLRVHAVKDGISTYTLYAKNGSLLGEYTELQTPLKEYFYLGGKLVAMVENADSDNNGLPDVWEIKYFGMLGVNPAGDPDGDGLTNQQELAAGTNPTVITPLPPGGIVTAAGPNKITLSWSPVAGATGYNLYWRTSPGVTKASGNKISGVISPYDHLGLIDGTRYYYVITSVRNAEESVESAEINKVAGVGAWTGAVLIETDNAGDATWPAIAGDSNGNAIVVWQQSDGTRTNIWFNRYTAGSGWGTATLLENDDTGNAQYPQIAMNGNGNAIVSWQQYNGTNTAIYVNRYVVGSGWTGAQLVSTTLSTEVPDPGAMVALNAAGNAVVVWSSEDRNPDRWHVWANYYIAGQGWQGPQRIEAVKTDSRGPAVTMDPGGNAVAVWYHSIGATTWALWSNIYTVGSGWGTAQQIESGFPDWSPDYDLVGDFQGNNFLVFDRYDPTISTTSVWYKQFLIGQGWQTSQRLDANNPATGYAPGILLGTNGTAMAEWGTNDGTGMLASRYTPSNGWEPTTSIPTSNTGNIFLSEIAADANGNTIAVWQQSDGTRTNIWANRYSLGSGWGTPMLIETDDTGSASFPGIVNDSAGNAIVVWQQSDGTRTNIWANRFVLFAP